MQLRTHARKAAAATAVVCASTLVFTSTDAVAAKDPNAQSKKFRTAVTPGGINLHLDAFARIARENGGNRAAGTPGYDASRNYVVQKLRAAGYKPQVQQFSFDLFTENTPTELQRVSPDPKTYTADDFAIMEYSGNGDVSAAVVPVDTALTPSGTSTSGCETADFAGFPAGAIALMQRGSCSFAIKAANAEAAGAGAAVIFNRGDAGEEGLLNGTLGGAGSTIPVVGTSFAVGQELGASGTTARVKVDAGIETTTSANVIAETPKGNADRVIMAGAHLDSVPEGAGINDNGSGSAAVLEMAEELAKVKKLKNKVRFAWWGAEESGLVGSEHYVSDLVANDPATFGEIGAYLNFDMVGSPNYARFVYDGDLSDTAPPTGYTVPEGSGDIEQLFNDYFLGAGLATDPTAFDGRSDYRAFSANGIPAGGLFTGAEDVKTAAQVRKYGGVRGVAFDPCYHAACDDRDNVNNLALDEMSDGAAHALYVLAQNPGLVQETARTTPSAKTLARQANQTQGDEDVR